MNPTKLRQLFFMTACALALGAQAQQTRQLIKPADATSGTAFAGPSISIPSPLTTGQVQSIVNGSIAFDGVCTASNGLCPAGGSGSLCGSVTLGEGSLRFVTSAYAYTACQGYPVAVKNMITQCFSTTWQVDPNYGNWYQATTTYSPPCNAGDTQHTYTDGNDVGACPPNYHLVNTGTANNLGMYSCAAN